MASYKDKIYGRVFPKFWEYCKDNNMEFWNSDITAICNELGYDYIPFSYVDRIIKTRLKSLGLGKFNTQRNLRPSKFRIVPFMDGRFAEIGHQPRANDNTIMNKFSEIRQMFIEVNQDKLTIHQLERFESCIRLMNKQYMERVALELSYFSKETGIIIQSATEPNTEYKETYQESYNENTTQASH